MAPFFERLGRSLFWGGFVMVVWLGFDYLFGWTHQREYYSTVFFAAVAGAMTAQI